MLLGVMSVTQFIVVGHIAWSLNTLSHELPPLAAGEGGGGTKAKGKVTLIHELPPLAPPL